MRDPVKDANGHTFERSAIERSLVDRPGICPLTNERYPNEAAGEAGVDTKSRPREYPFWKCCLLLNVTTATPLSSCNLLINGARTLAYVQKRG
jgi:hypothetical protein